MMATASWQAPKMPSEFVIGPANGFLPQQDPLTHLPPAFDSLSQLLDDMPLRKDDGSPGLLHSGRFGLQVMEDLHVPDIADIRDTQLLSALFRDLTFVASAYLLEPCDIRYRQSGEYGVGRDRLPAKIARPLEEVANKLGVKPYMEYALSYCLYNYKRKDLDGPVDYDNLALIRKFSGCPDEHGFILVHVSMVAKTAPLVESALKVLAATEHRDMAQLKQGLERYLGVMREINGAMETMWSRSQPEKYLSFRTFIMGITNQPMFPNGVVYEGTSSPEPRFYRGESGANDSIVPLGDNLFQLTRSMPDNPLTRALRDFRQYRPPTHKAFLNHVEEQAELVNVQSFAATDPDALALYIANLDQIRDFRHRHWSFTKEYILKRTAHAVATGGTPIVTWLPNQLSVVLRSIQASLAQLKMEALSPSMAELVQDIPQKVLSQQRILEAEVAKLRSRFPTADH